jgi:phosphate starvation-inducible PhoH-like protein
MKATQPKATTKGNKPAVVYTPKQRDFFVSTKRNHVTILQGPAGTGKTKCAVDAGVASLSSRDVRRLIITRPAVSVHEDHGFLPGSIEDKMRPWMLPIYDNLMDHFTQSEVDALVRERVIEIAPLAYMRGRTFVDAFVICDEAQNCTVQQMKMVLTRIGRDSKMVVVGDPDQDDLGSLGVHPNGLTDIIGRMDSHGAPPGVGLVVFDASDTKRHVVLPGILKLYA